MVFFLFLFVQLCIAGALIVLLRYVLKKHFGSASSHLEVLSQDSMSKLDEAKRKLDEANKYFSDIQVKAKEAGEQEKQRLISEGIKEKQDLLEQARKQSEEIMQRAKATANALTEEVDQRIRETASKKAYETIQHLLPGKMSEETHSKWVEDLLESPLDNLDHLNLSENVNGVEVSSAFSLKPAERKKLEDRLKQKLKRTVTVNEKVDPTLMMGMRVKIGNIVMDSSLKFSIEEALRNVRNKNS